MTHIYDVAIIGGGINGAAVACYACSRGLTVALFEKGSCGEQTTAGSSRLIHGGLRYLSHNTGTTIASCADSGLILRMVPHLVERRAFILPLFAREQWMMEFAETYLELYDRYQALKDGKRHVRLTASDVRALVPGIRATVTGGITFDEWLIDPVRLVREHVESAKSLGADIFENTEIREIRRSDEIFTLQAASSQLGIRDIHARTVVNAAGPWVSRIAQLLGARISLRPTKGVHLVLKGRATPYGIVAKTSLHTRLFITPLEHTTLVGPTDDDAPFTNPDYLRATEWEAHFLSQAAEAVLPGITQNHPIIGTHAALRALPHEPGSARNVSRDFQIIPHDCDGIPGAISVFSGKLSEYHLMASRVTEYIGLHAQGKKWQESFYASRLPGLTPLPMTQPETKRMRWLLNRYTPTTHRLSRQLGAWAHLAFAFAAHWPKKIFSRRRGLAVFYETYGKPPAPVDAAALTAEQGTQDLRALAGDTILCTDASARSALAHDAWPRLFLHKTENIPVAVARPGTTEELSQVLAHAHRNRIPVIPFGAGSGVCGAVVPVKPSITIDMSRFSGIHISDQPPCVTVGAGVLGMNLEKAVNAHRTPYTLGHFPASMEISTVGGWLGTRSSGQESTKYGNIDDMVLSLEMAFPDGTVQECTGEHARKLIGTEGTLCVFTKATFVLHPIPVCRLFKAYRFGTFSGGINALESVLARGLRPNVLRLYDAIDTALTLGTHEHSGQNPFPRGARMALRHPSVAGRALLLAEHLGLAKPTLILSVADAERIAQESFFEAHDTLMQKGTQDIGQSIARHWFMRRYALNRQKLHSIFAKGAFVNTLDLDVNWGCAQETYQAVRRAILPYALPFAHLSHASAHGACLYVTYVGMGRTAQENAALYDAARDAALSACIASGGRIAHHHAVGLEKLHFWKLSDPERYREIAELKKRYDPHGIMNPGKLV